MAGRRIDPAGLAGFAAALGDVEVVRRYATKVVRVPGSDCLWWTGAVSGRGHGRFWFADGRCIVAHRFAFGLQRGVQELEDARVLGHRCDNPLCQRVAPGHVVVSSAQENRREWAHRKEVAGSPLGDPRGARRRARALRDMARRDPREVAAELDRLRRLYGEQMQLPLG
ncbi:hypothetical protein [Flexivirga caeni]|uniref:HNH endonuclease n=1 Tax=Flexivirga caeni TaxID=2294115 RepID=A0A3M9MH29_9MICO|nr:hypothetical protein [Flexivirga caeni]RNI24804.1 hypothetical protein EFY87_03695 [Flexivirga caeni]